MDSEGFTSRAWLGHWVSGEDEPVNNYYEDHKLMEGALIKLGDYAHFRYFLLFRNGRFCYYELPMPAAAPSGGPEGPRRVHLTLTSKHLRGVMMLNASVNGKDLAKSEDEYGADLLKRGLVFNRKKLEMQLTGFSPTGQLMSWKLRAGKDAVYLKWERAFRLALRPIWVQNSKYCMVCKKDFSFFIRPHHCRKCGTCMCDECSVFVPRLPIQGYYDEVRICRDCSPIKIQRSALKLGTQVLVYGVLIGRVAQVDAADDSDEGRAFVNVELAKKNNQLRQFALEHVELYSDAVLSANRIKNAIRQHLSYAVFRTQLNFNTWNLLETVQEQRTVQMVRILNKSTSINELHSMVPMLGSWDTMLCPDDDITEKERVKASLAHYRGVHVGFPLRLDTVKRLINQFRNGILLHRVFVRQILDESEKLFRKKHTSPMNNIEIPVGVQLVVVGDLHGQLEDLLTIMDENGAPSSKTWYVFNGDFVDRGSHGIEVMLLLLIFKLLYPDFVFLNRGNHEERMINEVFGFEDEIYTKFLSYFHQLAEEDKDGSVDFQKFLNRYTIELDGGNVEWRRNLIRKVWMGFCQALPHPSNTDTEKMTLHDKLHLAFNLFQSSSENGKKEQTVKSDANGQSGGSLNGDKMPPRESYLRNNLVTYEVFRSTIQGKLELGDILSEQQIFELMQHLDQNHDGVVDYQEFCSFFAEFSRTDYLQELFEVDDTKAISLLNRCATLLQNPNKFKSLREAFDSFDHSKTGKLTVEDIFKGTQELNMVPDLDQDDAQLLFNSILRSYYGINQRHQWETRGLDWVVFEDTFSPDSTFQRRLWLTSLDASSTNLAAMDAQDSLSGDDDSVKEGQTSTSQTWADTFVDSVKQSLHEQRLYIKFIFRILDRKRHGYVTKEKFIATMQAINEEHGSPLQLSQLEQLADAFSHPKAIRRMPAEGGEMEETHMFVSYPEFLRSLRIIDSGPSDGNGATVEITSCGE
ncbi:hypothetical protein BBO99_00002563 [Phytophthora kernoviae]|uniref:Serine/threonine-protein phosphatase n=1 Tax=Phytophthora kernoviae TaxID=325452 RepID=A0A3R7H515_9STRA|nr:hypothetical protein JM16_003504 [Phytophthora kernoviae]RLN20945.1 hypothetical protein BBI17_002462 [Phytophthora kernoviae]RLN82896.1 hypothetical protein BBO99_00002563 [Phytophthora kernoviae]